MQSCPRARARAHMLTKEVAPWEEVQTANQFTGLAHFTLTPFANTIITLLSLIQTSTGDNFKPTWVVLAFGGGETVYPNPHIHQSCDINDHGACPRESAAQGLALDRGGWSISQYIRWPVMAVTAVAQ